MKHIGFDSEMSQSILNSFDDKDEEENLAISIIKLKYLKKLAYTKLIDKETAITDNPIDLIELANLIMDHESLMQKDESLARDYLSATFFRVILAYPSLFFFRSRHLHRTLDLLASSPFYKKESAFWVKSEDLINRVIKQLTTKEITDIVSIYCKVPAVSQLFWSNIEKIILTRSADFKGHKDLVLKVILAIGG